MLISDFAKLVSKYAPVLGTLLGSPMAGTIVSLISAHFESPSDDLDEIATQIQADPIRLKQLEFKHSESLASFALNFINETEARAPAWMNGLLAMISLSALIGGIAYWFWIKS